MNHLKTIGWGLYLTSSWTWCIGMFLPVVLLHRYGWSGVLLFAIPNILGCAAFGYIVKTPQYSKSMVKKYGRIMGTFSIVTIAFHAFFLLMLFKLDYLSNQIDMNPLVQFITPTKSALIILAIAIFLYCLRFLPNMGWIIFGSICWIMSIFFGFAFLPLETSVETSRAWTDMIWLLPITTFGFLLCPYLDATFHKALQSSPSKHCFGVFGIAFAAMIVVTCLYQEVILKTLPLLLIIHVCTQCAFSISTHFFEGIKVWGDKRKNLYFILLLFSSTIALLIANNNSTVVEYTEDYLRFFLFYGLIFPGLVFLLLLKNASLTSGRIICFIVFTLACLPLLEAAYLGIEPWLSIIPILGLVAWDFANCNANQQGTT